MISAPFEVVQKMHGFTWRLIGACGRPLVYTDKVYPTDIAAAESAKAARAEFAEIALMRDEA